MTEAMITGPVKCFTVINGHIDKGIPVYGSCRNRAVLLDPPRHGSIPVDETASSAGLRLDWVKVVNSGGELKILPCKPPETTPEHSFDALVHLIAVDSFARPLLQYNNERVWTRILSQVQTCGSGSNSHHEGLSLLALLASTDRITVFENQFRGPLQSFSEAWSVDGAELLRQF